jgi:hypothetical protein
MVTHGPSIRESAATFDGVHEAQMAPPRVAMDDIIRWGSMKNNFLSNGGHPRSQDPAKIYGIKCVPTLFELEYWRVTL